MKKTQIRKERENGNHNHGYDGGLHLKRAFTFRRRAEQYPE